MKILVDMNLSPEWIEVFDRHGWEARHWSDVGNPRDADRVILEWARLNGYTRFTHDLDFGVILALTEGESPSVIQFRSHDVMPSRMEKVAVAALRQYAELLESGALVTVNEDGSRARILPLRS